MEKDGIKYDDRHETANKVMVIIMVVLLTGFVALLVVMGAKELVKGQVQIDAETELSGAEVQTMEVRDVIVSGERVDLIGTDGSAITYSTEDEGVIPNKGYIVEYKRVESSDIRNYFNIKTLSIERVSSQ